VLREEPTGHARLVSAIIVQEHKKQKLLAFMINKSNREVLFQVTHEHLQSFQVEKNYFSSTYILEFTLCSAVTSAHDAPSPEG
jgi:hypothetical protein